MQASPSRLWTIERGTATASYWKDVLHRDNATLLLVKPGVLDSRLAVKLGTSAAVVFKLPATAT
jgi:hypothetical protein